MTAELSRELALAIGWKYVYPNSPETKKFWKHEYAAVSEGPGPRGTMLIWRRFDYRSSDVALPLLKWIGEQYRVFFWWCSPTDKRGALWSSSNGVIADTLEEAIARAVIAVKGKP